MSDLSWGWILVLASTGIIMALVSSLVGMRPRVEIPSWWALYAAWIVVVLVIGNDAPFRTILISSILAGIVHGLTQALLIDSYLDNNPWHADKMTGPPRSTLEFQFILSGVLFGAAFGVLVATIAWALALI